MVNKLSALLVFTWMIVIPSMFAWDANAELPESTGVVCESPPVQIVKLAPFKCTTRAEGLVFTVMNCE